jgi:hypothetical protein
MKKSEKISEINNRLSVAIAEEKTKLAKAELEYRERVTVLMAQAQIKREEATDDPEEQQHCDQPTQWLNGEQWTCAVVARRILNKLPKLNSPKESFYIEISPSYFGGCALSFRYINTINKESGFTNCELLAKDTEEEQSTKVDLWLKEVEVEMAKAQTMREEADNE